MPEISRFDGIVISMFLRKSEHNPPHIHAVYGEFKGYFAIEDGQMVDGDMPRKQQKKIMSFINCYRDKLFEMWNTQQFEMLPPVR